VPWIAGLVVYAVVTLAITAVVLVSVTTAALNQFGMPHSLRKTAGQAGEDILYILAHPDDEVMIAGTVIQLGRMGFRTHGLYLTRGEDGPTGGLVAKEQLGDFRETELAKAARILGLSSLTVLRFRDRHLPEEDHTAMADAIKQKIALIHPAMVIGFDRELGLYGHADHVMAGLLARDASAEPTSGVRAYMEMTLPAPQVRLAARLSKTFRESAAGGKLLPTPNLAVNITRVAVKKMQLIGCHASQWQVMRELLPFHHKVPAWLYFLIFGREYFRVEYFSIENT